MIEYRVVRTSEVQSMIDLWRNGGLPIREKGRESKERLIAEMETNPSGFIGAFDKDEMIGIVIATSDGRKGWVNRLVVAAPHRKSGIGFRLVQLAEEELKSRGIEIVSTLIEKGTDASFALFKKAGYEFRDDIVYLRKELVKGA